MKKMKPIGLIATLILVIFGCTKVVDPAGKRNAAVVPAISGIQPGIFDSKDLVNSFVQFTLSLASGDQAEGADLVASYNGNNAREDITTVSSFPATVKITSGDVIQKLGLNTADIKNGDVFLIEVLTTSNGESTWSNAVLNVPVACAFEAALSTGSYHSVSTDWNSQGNITLTADQNDPYTIYVTGIEAIEDLNEDKGPLVMHINPATYAVTADKSVIASDAFGYHNIAYQGSGTYNSCDGSFAMNFDISVDEGDFGLYTFTFTKNP